MQPVRFVAENHIPINLRLGFELFWINGFMQVASYTM